MRLIEQLILKKIELYEEQVLHRNYLRAISHFYAAYAISLALVEKTDPLLTVKNSIWWRVLRNPENISRGKLKSIQHFVPQDMRIINEAQEKIREAKESAQEGFGDIFREGTLGVIAYEYPMEEV